MDRKGRQVYVISDATTQIGKHVVEVFGLDGTHLRTMGGGRSPAPGTCTRRTFWDRPAQHS